jgi:hypothetical protein
VRRCRLVMGCGPLAPGFGWIGGQGNFLTVGVFSFFLCMEKLKEVELLCAMRNVHVLRKAWSSVHHGGYFSFLI